MKMERIERFNEAYANDDLKKCEFELLFLMLMYNTDIRNGKEYEYDLKHILFKTNCIRNPIGMKYTSKDYKKTAQILTNTLKIAKTINDPEIDTREIIQEGITIDKRIIKDICDIAAYTECFYKMNSVNSTRMDECEGGKIPFVEQLISLVVFHQDQTRLVKENYKDFINPDYQTGMELSIANRPVEHYKNLEGSVLDNFESILESMNEIIHYLYYRFGENLKVQIVNTDIQRKLVHPYENAEFEKYLYIASQRFLICRIEEGIRYGYYKIGYVNKNQEGIREYVFSIENDEKYKARRMGVLRREYQVRNHILLDYRNQGDIPIIYEKLSILSDELIKIQAKKYELFEFSEFHPDKSLFQDAEKVAEIKERIVESLTKDYYLDCKVKGVCIRDLLITYKYLDTLSEVLYLASSKCIDDKKQDTYIKEISLVEISYLEKELSRIHEFELEYAKKLIDRFIFHEKKNRDDDIFSQPLLIISKSQVILSQALLDQVNLDRFIERQFIRYKKNVADVGHIFENKFIEKLKRGYSKGIVDFEYKEIPNFQINTNKVKYEAFDGKEIEYDVISVLGEYLILTELKAVMTSYELNELEKRKENVKEAIEQLKRRKKSVRYDWEIFKKLVSIDLPDKPYDEDHIILIACTDAYDYTPLKKNDVFITDDSSYLKYFTNPYLDVITAHSESASIQKVKSIWKNGYPEAEEFKEYLMNPVTIFPFANTITKKYIPVPVMDEKDYAIVCEEYILTEDPIVTSMQGIEKMQKKIVRNHFKKIYPNELCPCGSGKKFKKCHRGKGIYD